MLSLYRQEMTTNMWTFVDIQAIELNEDIGDVSKFTKREMNSEGLFDAALIKLTGAFREDFENTWASHEHGPNSGVTHNAIVGDGLCQLKCITCGNKRGELLKFIVQSLVMFTVYVILN